MPDFLKSIFSTNILIARERCVGWQPEFIGLQVASDVAIALAYLSIFLILINWVRQHQDLRLSKIFWNVTDSPEQQQAEELERYRDRLEDLVKQRTAELIRLNQHLQQEIAERCQTELALRESQEKYRVLFQTLPIGITITDKNGQILEVNAASERILGISTIEQTKRTVEDLGYQLIGSDGSSLQVNEFASVRALKENKTIANEEAGIVRADGQINWISITAVPIPLGGYGVAIAYVDITERKQAELALQESERRFRAIFDQTFQFVGLLEPNGTVLEANQTVLDFAGLEQSEIVGQLFWEKFWRTITLETQAKLKRAIQQAANGKFIRYEVEVKGAGDRAAILDFSLKPVTDETGKVILLIPEGRDITDRKQAELALRLAAEREQLLTQMQAQIHQSLNLTEILNTTVAQVQQLLDCDRVILFRFNSDWSGKVIVESVGCGWESILDFTISDTCFSQHYVQLYQAGRTQAWDDIYHSNLSPCHLEYLAQMQIRANLIVPIVNNGQLWGLLGAHHCASPRVWQDWEINFLVQLASQVAIAISQAQLYQQLETANLELQRLANLDGLTQVANRRRFDEYLDREWQQHQRESSSLALILCDVDFFKLYNDTYGHPAGDECLKQIAFCLTQAAYRCADLVSRYGGEEFAVILPNTEIQAAIDTAQAIQTAVKALNIPHCHSPLGGQVTLSLGLACQIPAADITSATLVEAADTALYQAKQTGRDCLKIA